MITAMILCAGFGTRLKEYTKEIPKPMLPILDKPILEYTIRHLAWLGINNVIINLHYQADKIVSYFQDGQKWGIRITYSYEEKPLGTAGAVKKMEHVLSKTENFLLLYGDVVTNENYINLLNYHKSKSTAIATIVLHQRLNSNSIVEMDNENRITKFIERPKNERQNKKQNWINSGLYCLNKQVLQYIPERKFSDFPKDVFPHLIVSGRLYGYPLTGYRCAIDSPQRYSMVQSDFKKQLIFEFQKKGRNRWSYN